MPDKFDFDAAQDHDAPTEDVVEETVGRDESSPVEQAPEKRPKVSVKLKTDALVPLESPATVEVPGYDPIELSDSPTSVDAVFADLLLTSNLVVAA